MVLAKAEWVRKEEESGYQSENGDGGGERGTEKERQNWEGDGRVGGEREGRLDKTIVV